MKYLGKRANSEIIEKKLNYETNNQREEIRKLLVQEQNQFCAYSERYIKETDSVDIEHFDGRLKSSEEDNYYNWYGVLTWFNSHKPKKIDPFIPFLIPHSADLKDRIKYENGIYIIINEEDIEAQNLIDYLGFNKVELFNDRKKHINRIATLLEMLNKDIDSLKEHFKKDKDSLSFATAIEVEFEIDLEDLIF
ncbi:MAG: hypothetical protein COA40_00990 [Aequorivita sp.]|nr:MAG: hypothetical protein COA40_00990 [Aequorivita sp.]